MIFTHNGRPVTSLTWAAPTARGDGTAYGASQHAGYELGVSDPTNATDGFLPHVSVPAAYNATDWPLDDLNINAAGTYEVALRTVDTEGRTSAWSNPLVYSVDLAAPNAPTGVSAS